MIGVATILALGGFFALALGMERHQRSLLRWPIPFWIQRRLRFGALGAFVLSYAAVAQSWGAAIGAMLWAGLLSLSAATVVLAMSWWEHRQ